MSIYEINPVTDPRWADFTESHSHASVFHSAGWLNALRLTYGYEPLVLTTSRQDQPLRNGLVLCKVNSWMTGSRLVSLPFSDHCQPLLDNPQSLAEMLGYIERHIAHKGLKYLELRPLEENALPQNPGIPLRKSEFFYLHSVDLRPPLEEIFKTFHKSCVQRKLSRASRDGLRIEEGCTPSLLFDFYKLMVLTRRRHKVPPQPFSWFKNLCNCLDGRATIRAAYKDQVPVAAILTLTFNKSVVYKYGCSDPNHHKLGGTLSLFWRTIQVAKEQGFEDFDLGRSDVENTGLLEFKDHWGAHRKPLQYFRWARSPINVANGNDKHWKRRLAEGFFSRLPDPLFVLTGKLLYKHIG